MRLRMAKSIEEIAAAERDYKVFKACNVKNRKTGRLVGPRRARKIAIVTMVLPKEAMRNTANLRVGSKYKKMRASECKVLAIEANGKSLPRSQVACSYWNASFHYRVGRTVKPRRPFNTSFMVCASGIHFFRTRKEAESYLR